MKLSIKNLLENEMAWRQEVYDEVNRLAQIAQQNVGIWTIGAELAFQGGTVPIRQQFGSREAAEHFASLLQKASTQWGQGFNINVLIMVNPTGRKMKIRE